MHPEYRDPSDDDDDGSRPGDDVVEEILGLFQVPVDLRALPIERGNPFADLLLRLHMADIEEEWMEAALARSLADSEFKPHPAAPTVVASCLRPAHVQGTCAICLDDATPLDAELQPCEHNFHRACIERWLTESADQCPVCRVLAGCAPKESENQPAGDVSDSSEK